MYLFLILISMPLIGAELRSIVEGDVPHLYPQIKASFALIPYDQRALSHHIERPVCPSRFSVGCSQENKKRLREKSRAKSDQCALLEKDDAEDAIAQNFLSNLSKVTPRLKRAIPDEDTNPDKPVHISRLLVDPSQNKEEAFERDAGVCQSRLGAKCKRLEDQYDLSGLKNWTKVSLFQKQELLREEYRAKQAQCALLKSDDEVEVKRKQKESLLINEDFLKKQDMLKAQDERIQNLRLAVKLRLNNELLDEELRLKEERNFKPYYDEDLIFGDIDEL